MLLLSLAFGVQEAFSRGAVLGEEARLLLRECVLDVEGASPQNENEAAFPVHDFFPRIVNSSCLPSLARRGRVKAENCRSFGERPIFAPKH